MDAHSLLGHIAIYATLVGDGGPRSYRRRGKALPEKYLPGRFLDQLRPEQRAGIVHAVNARTSPAPWFLALVVDESEPRVKVPPPPVDRRWACRGRWATP